MREEHKTRMALIEAARDLFLANGYHSTGVAQIVRTANVRMGSLYYFFPTKEDLLIAVLEWYRDHIYEGLLKPVYERIDDPWERVFGILDGYRQLLMVSDFDLGCPIGNLALELANSHPRARELMVANFRQWSGEVRKCLDAASDRMPPDVDRVGLAEHILTVMEGAVMLSRTYRDISSYDNAVTHLRDYMERLISDGTNWCAPTCGTADGTIKNGGTR